MGCVNQWGCILTYLGVVVYGMCQSVRLYTDIPRSCCLRDVSISGVVY